VVVEQLCRRSQASIIGVASVRGIALPDAVHVIVPCDGIGPAPALTLSSGPDDVADGYPQSRVLTGSEASAAAGSDRRWLAVALLASGVAVLLAVALVRRRLGREEGAGARRQDLQGVEEVAAGPQLTLVRVPDEHGS
jgi:hypothetical protein